MAAHNWPSIVPVRGEFGRGAFLGSSRSSDSLWRIGAARFQVKWAGVKKHGLAGHIWEDA
jgi:hypothetical protein